MMIKRTNNTDHGFRLIHSGKYNLIAFLGIFFLILIAPHYGFAQDQDLATEGSHEASAAQDTNTFDTLWKQGDGSEDESLPPRNMENYSAVRIRALDKITARTETIILNIGDTVDFGALSITARTCQKTPPVEEPESASFLEISERAHRNWDDASLESNSAATPQFNGWMFASSPGLSAMDHPIYDIWVLDCDGELIETTEEAETDVQDETSESPPLLD